MTTTMQQVGGSGGMPPRRFFIIRCSKIASETIFGPKLATALTRASVVHTTLDSLGHQLCQGISLVHGASISFILAHPTNTVTV